MRQKIIGMMLWGMVGAGIMAGCARTPEESLVKQKGEASLKNYEEAEPPGTQGESAGIKSGGKTPGDSDDTKNAGQALKDSGENAEEENSGKDGAGVNENKASGILRETLAAPEHYQSEMVDETGKLQILTDADVEIPDAGRVSAIEVNSHPFAQTEIDRITDTFFPDDDIYSASSYYVMTKADYQKKIEGLKGYVAQGNLDPFDYGTDEEGNYIFDIYGRIEEAEQRYEEAPESKQLEAIHPQLGLEEDIPDYFGGIACREDGTAFEYTCTPTEVRIQKIHEAENWGSMLGWSEYRGLKASVENVPDVEEISQEIGITLEEAQKIADEKVEALQLDNMEMTSWEYGILWEGEQGYTPEGQQDVGYMLHYTRKLQGIPITYTKEWGGELESMDSVMENWGYERLDFIITEEGIDTVEFCNQYDVGEIRTENLSLMSFEKIMGIYEKMMMIQNADVINYESARTYYIDRIAFGYSRIYEPSTDSRSGLLVPVWDFFGSFEFRRVEQGQEYDSVNAAEYQSYLTINAIDGSIIDRGLGY